MSYSLLAEMCLIIEPLSSHLFEQQMLWLEGELQEGGIKAFGKLRKWKHQIESAKPAEEKELYKKLQSYGLNIYHPLFPGDEWTTPEIRVYRDVGFPLEFYDQRRIDGYFSLLDKTFQEMDEKTVQEIRQEARHEKNLRLLIEKILNGEIKL